MIKKLSPTSYFKECLFENPEMPKRKRKKVTIEEFVIPNFREYNKIINNNFNVSQLKSIARFYKIKISGNKKELIKRVWNFLKFSHFSLKVQKIWRGYIVREYNNISKIKKCVNSTDFLSLNELDSLPINQIFCFEDDDNFVYGFDAKSFHNLLLNNKEPKNPYNRKVISNKVINKFNKFIRYGKILGIKTNLKIIDDITNLSIEKKIELRAHTIFQKIDTFGHITDANWFLHLNRNRLKKLLLELNDIWNYRASLTPQIKESICPPNGNPFTHINPSNLHIYETNTLKKKILKVFNKLITSGIDENAKSLGAFYILGSITLVSQAAASALPWLYESVYYNPNQNNS